MASDLVQSVPAPRQPLHTGHVQAPPGGAVTVDALIAAVRADAAGLAGRNDPAALSASAEAVTWNDGALGCPQPGLLYTQALVPGWRIVVGDGTREWVYHASRRGSWIRCPAGMARRPLPGDATR